MSVLTSDPVTCNSAGEEYAGPNVDLTLSDLTLTVTQVLYVLANLDASKVTSPDEIPPRFFGRQHMRLLHPYANYSTSLSDWGPSP